MAEEVVLTRFVGDTSGLEASAATGTKAIQIYDKSVDAATKSTVDLSGAMGDAAKKATILGNEGKKAADNISEIGKKGGGIGGLFTDIGAKASAAWSSIKTGASQLVGDIKVGFGLARSFSIGALEGIRDGAKDAFSGVKGESNAASKEVAEVGKKGKDSLGDLGAAAKDAGSQLKDSLTQGASDATGGISDFAIKALSSLGPIGIAAAAVGATLIAAFANTDAGATYFDGMKRSGGAAFDIITGKVMGFFSALTDGQSVIGKVFGYLLDAVNFITKPMQLLIKGIGDLTGISDVLAAANKQGRELAKMYDNIDEAQTNNIVKNAELEKQISALNIQLRNRALTDQQRYDLNDQLAAKEKERSDAEIANLKLVTATKKQQFDNDIANGKGKDKAHAKELAQAKADEIKAQEESANLVDRAQNRINAIKDAAAARDVARRNAAAAAQAKADADELAQKQKLYEAEAKAAEISDKADAAARRERLSKPDQQKFDLNAGVDAQIATAKDAFAKLKELHKGSAIDIEIINADEAKALVDINTVRNDALAKLDQENIDAYKALTETKQQLEKEAINKEFDAAEAGAKSSIKNAQDLTEALLALEQARAKALSEIKTQAQIDDEKSLKETQRAQAEIIKSTGAEIATVLESFGAGQIKTAKEANDALVSITLDTVGAIVQAKIVELIARSAAFGADAGPVGAAIGLAGGIAIGALLKGLLASLKAQILGRAGGEDYVSGPAMWAGTDGHLRRLDTGERVVRTKTNEAHWDALEAMEKGTFGKWMDMNHDPVFPDLSSMMALNFAPKLNKYLESSEGRRMASEVTLPGFFDKNIVAAHRAATKEQRVTNDLLRAMLPGKSRPSRSRRYDG